MEDDRICEFLNFIAHSIYVVFVKHTSAYLVKVGELNLPFPISSEFLMSCYMSCHFFLPIAIVFRVAVFYNSFFLQK